MHLSRYGGPSLWQPFFIATRHRTKFLYLSGGILKTVNKLIVIKSNAKNFDKSRLKTAKIMVYD